MSEDLHGGSGNSRSAGAGAPEAGQVETAGAPGGAGRAQRPGFGGDGDEGVAQSGSDPNGGGRDGTEAAARSVPDRAALRPQDIEAGSRDQSGRPVTWVYWSTEDYAIYQWSREVPRSGPLAWLAGLFSKTHPMRIEYGISPHFGRPDQRVKYALIHRDLSEIYGLQQGRLACRESINREIARAIMLALEDKAEVAQAILNHLRERLVRMRNIEGRASYLGACMGSMLIALTVLIAALLAADAEVSWLDGTILPLLGPDLLLLKVIVCGALGAFLSVCLSIQQLEIDPETPRKVNRISGITRLVIGMAASLIVYLAIGAGIVLADGLSLQVPDGGRLSARVTAGILLLAVVAGFSEVFVPNILRRVGGDDATNGAPGGATTREAAIRADRRAVVGPW